jgi:hypothetical protein
MYPINGTARIVHSLACGGVVLHYLASSYITVNINLPEYHSLIFSRSQFVGSAKFLNGNTIVEALK